MDRIYRLLIVFLLCGLPVGMAYGQTYKLSDGKTVTGELVSPDENGVIPKAADGSFGDRVSWGKFSQADLKELQQNPKMAPYVEPFIEISQEEKLKRTEIPIKEVPRLPREKKGSVIGALAGSALGWVILLAIYGANIYAGYEIAIFRGRAPAIVAVIAAVAPVLGPAAIFFMGPAKVKREPDWQPPAEEYADAGVAAAVAAEQQLVPEAARQEAAASPGTHVAHHPKPEQASVKSWQRGQFTFNRRFFETQMPGFFGVVRPEADKDMVLSIRAARGSYIGQRITRISPTEMHLLVQKGHASEDVAIPFVEIQEVAIRPREA